MKALDYFYEEYISTAVDWLAEFGESFVRFIFNGILFIVLLVTIPVWILPYKLSKKNNKAEIVKNSDDTINHTKRG